jgi:ABC-2 type transport system ATP-binding protein
MWAMVRRLRDRGVTIILTTHYIDEAEELADRIGVISKGQIILVEDKAALMQKLGKKQLSIQLQAPLSEIPKALNALPLALSPDGSELTYTFDAKHQGSGIADLMRQLAALNIDIRDLQTQQSSLEDIFVTLVSERA